MIRLFSGFPARALALGLALAATASCDMSSTAPPPENARAASERVAEQPSEERVQEIWNSREVAHLMDLHAEFVARVDSALKSGVSMDELRAASHKSANGDDSRLASLLFGGRKGADQYVASLLAARSAITETYPEIYSARGRVDSSGCNVDGNAVDSFFNNFDAIRDAEVSGRNLPPRCDPFAYLVCTVGCMVSGTSGLGIAWCAYNCMCKYCPLGVPCGFSGALDP